MYFVLENNNAKYKKQVGFRNDHSTTHAFLELTGKMTESCDSNKSACDLFQTYKRLLVL